MLISRLLKKLEYFGVKTPWVSSLTSSSKRYCTLNVVSHDCDCVSTCTKKDYGLHFHLIGDHIIHKHLILCLHLGQILVPRSLCRYPSWHRYPRPSDKIVGPLQNQLIAREDEQYSTWSWTHCVGSCELFRSNLIIRPFIVTRVPYRVSSIFWVQFPLESVH